MRRSVLVALALLPLAAGLVSCMLPAEPGPEPASVASAPEAPAPEAEVTAPAIEEQDDPEAPELQQFLPLGAFPSLEALCAAQERLVAPRIEEARKQQAEDGFLELGDVRARCEAEDLAKVDVQLGAPFLEVRAITFETGYATRKHVVVRTEAGWRALPHAFASDEHMDPGCFSIERETGLQAIRVEGGGTPALVLIDGTDRGVMEPAAAEDDASSSWIDLSRRAIACRIAAGRAACDEPVVLRVERVPSETGDGRAPSIRFETPYAVDDGGHVAPARTFDPTRLAE